MQPLETTASSLVAAAGLMDSPLSETSKTTGRFVTVSDVVDKAISENRFSELLLYGYATLLFLTGIGLVIFGASMERPWALGGGGVTGALVWPAMAYAKKIRLENVAVRLMEAALMKAETAIDAANAIKEHFLRVHTEAVRNVSKVKKG